MFIKLNIWFDYIIEGKLIYFEIEHTYIVLKWNNLSKRYNSIILNENMSYCFKKMDLG